MNLSVIMEYIFPPRCAVCGMVTKPGIYLCKSCRNKIPRLEEKRILRIPPDGRIVSCYSPYWYRDEIRSSILRFKGSHHTEYAKWYGEEIAAYLIRDGKDQHSFDVVTSVPLSLSKRNNRGYNQAELIAKEVARRMNLKDQVMLKKREDHQEQHKLSRLERQKNVKGKYSLLRSPRGKRILLIDDIVTTGSTLKECSLVLLNAGAEKVTCATVASRLG